MPSSVCMNIRSSDDLLRDKWEDSVVDNFIF